MVYLLKNKFFVAYMFYLFQSHNSGLAQNLQCKIACFLKTVGRKTNTAKGACPENVTDKKPSSRWDGSSEVFSKQLKITQDMMMLNMASSAHFCLLSIIRKFQLFEVFLKISWAKARFSWRLHLFSIFAWCGIKILITVD